MAGPAAQLVLLCVALPWATAQTPPTVLATTRCRAGAGVVDVALSVHPPGAAEVLHYTTDGAAPTTAAAQARPALDGGPVLLEVSVASSGGALRVGADMSLPHAPASWNVYEWVLPPCPAAAAAAGEGNAALLAAVGAAAAVLAVFGPCVLWKMNADHDALAVLREERCATAACLQAIAAMDLEGVAHVHALANPSEAMQAVALIAHNLAEYRKYLPAAVQPPGARASVVPVHPLPARDAEEVTICFTDIQGSTGLWQRAPIAMAVAVEISNAILRRVLRACEGREVKVTGDAFMLAFDAFPHAVTFAMDVQCQLYGCQTWPSELLADPLCEQSGAWGGLRMRVGLHTGPVRSEHNPIADRVEYTGTTVRTAAKIGAVAAGGAVCVEASRLEGLKAAHAELYAKLHVTVVEGVELKGLGGVALAVLLPVLLKARAEDCQLEVRHRQRVLLTDAPPAPAKRNPLRTPRAVQAARYGQAASDKDSDSMSVGSDTSSTLARDAAIDHVARGTCCAVRLLVDDAGDNQMPSPLPSQTHHPVLLLAADSQSTVTVPPLIETLRDALNGVLLCLERSKGAVLSMCNNTLYCGWNVTPRQHQPDHLQLCAEFCGSLTRYAPELTTHTAVCTGGVHSGCVGWGRQRCLAVFSPALASLDVLLHVAADYNVACVCAALPGQVGLGDGALQNAARPIDRVAFAQGGCGEEPRDVMTVSQVRTDILPLILERRELPADEERRWEWSREYAAAFAGGAHRTMQLNGGGDPVVDAVASAHKSRGSLPRYTVPFPLGT
eukprot:TRINITY_DN6703_c0_g1_i1.p1 TRINITY_DN6703_c0_g1~~TRINITY_DN6703_c0_g1_i1.p1  ORF type:complete len:784 (+),score=289.51 TRINITY_DN6703_c0_g1_i1:45-2396(+)